MSTPERDAAAGLSLQAFDAELLQAWRDFRAQQAADAPLAEVQQRFCALGLFPQPGWRWLVAGEALAVLQQSVPQLHGTLQRVLAAAHACWGRPGRDGLHHGGEDHCAAVTPALHALALGPAYAAAVFHAGRPLARQGPAVRRHAANLLVLLHHPTWPHRTKALAAAQAAATGSAGPAADRALLATLVALLQADGTALQQALPAFAAAYPRSDWGRHLPQRQPVVLANLLALARRHVPAAVVEALAPPLLGAERAALWQAHAQALDSGTLAPGWPWAAWGGELAFLGPVPGLESAPET